MPLTETQSWARARALLCPRPGRTHQPAAPLLLIIDQLRAHAHPYALYPEVQSTTTLNLYDQAIYDETFGVRRLMIRSTRKPAGYSLSNFSSLPGHPNDERQWTVAHDVDIKAFLFQCLEQLDWPRR